MKNQTVPDYPRIILSPTSSSESEWGSYRVRSSISSQPRTSGLRTNRSLDLTLNQINQALGSFKIFNSEEYLHLKEIFGAASQKSRITDSNKNINKPKRPNRARGRPKKEVVKTATETNPDAENVDEAAKSLTRSKSKALTPQQLQNEQQEDENNKLSQQQLSDQLIANYRAPSKSGLTIKRIL